MCPRGRPRGQGRPRGLHLCEIGYFGHNKLSFNWLKMFLDTKKKNLVLVGYTSKSLGRLVRRWNKGRQKMEMKQVCGKQALEQRHIA